MALFDGCVAAWKLSDLTDATGPGNTLTNNNSATFNTGKIGNAVYVAAASSQYLSKATSADVELSSDFTIAFWAWHTSFSGGKNIAIGKDASGQREYYLYSEDVGTNNNRWKFSAFSGGGTQKDVTANNFGDISTGVWLCVIAWWDSAAQQLGISVNDGTPNTFSVGAALDGAKTSEFDIGRRSFSGFENHFDGRIDAVHIWKRVLSSTERTTFYNSGTGVEFSTPESTTGPALFRGRNFPLFDDDQVNRFEFWPAAAASNDVTLALTGVSVTGNAGSLGISRTSSLTGSAATTSIGTLAPGLSTSISGNTATSSAGSVTTGRTVGLAGVSGLTSVGTPGSTRTVSVSGSSATSAVGTVTPVVGVTVALTGVSATTSVGSLSPSVSKALTGVSVTSAVGTVTPTTGVVIALTGVSATTSVGTVSPSTSKGLTGSSATSSAGALTAGRAITIAGASAATTVGSLTTSRTVSLTGVNAIASVGTLSILGDDALAVSKNVGSAILFTAHVGTGVLRTRDTQTATLVTTNAGVAEIVYQDVRTDT
jgi:concanavalin A-like lectin/glucanase superfamily protein